MSKYSSKRTVSTSALPPAPAAPACFRRSRQKEEDDKALKCHCPQFRAPHSPRGTRAWLDVLYVCRHLQQHVITYARAVLTTPRTTEPKGYSWLPSNSTPEVVTEELTILKRTLGKSPGIYNVEEMPGCEKACRLLRGYGDRLRSGPAVRKPAGHHTSHPHHSPTGP